MATITKIAIQRRNAERYNIFLDGTYAFSVDEEVLARFQLKKGKKLTEDEIGNILHEDDIRKGMHIAVKYLSFRMRSEKEIRDHLRSKNIAEENISAIMDKLQQYSYIDDQAFAKAYVRTQINTTKKGPELVRKSLEKKGINDQFIDIAMQEFDETTILAHTMKLASKIMKQKNRYSHKQLTEKIQQTLLRKGYSYETMTKTLAKLQPEKNEEEEWRALQAQGMKTHRRYRNYDGREYEQKMKRSLYRKGFALEQIERFLEEIREEK